MVGNPDVNVDGVQNGKERETPGDGIDNGSLSTGEELVDDGSKEQSMNECPDEECPRGWGYVRLFSIVVDGGGASNGVDV